jgi:hypothetical protein
MPYRAHLHYNEARSLAFMDDLLETEFGITSTAGGSCLLAQVAYSIHAQTGIPVQAIVDHVEARIDRVVDSNGHTMQEITDALEFPIRTEDGFSIAVEFDLAQHHTVRSVTDCVLHGIPVLVIMSSESAGAAQHEADAYKDGTIETTPIRAAREMEGEAPGLRYHTFMVIGVDIAGYLVLRDTRHQYAYKGFLKMNTVIADTYFKNMYWMSLEVTSAHPWFNPQERI